MKTWNQLFIRHGWLLREVEPNVFDCGEEREENISFLTESLEKVSASFSMDGKQLLLQSEPVKESRWVDVVDFNNRGRGEGLYFRPREEDAKLRELDTYIAGVVRQLNRLGFYTKMSCDGHGRRNPQIYLSKDIEIKMLMGLLSNLGMKRARYTEGRNDYILTLPVERENLLDLAEKFHYVEKDWMKKGVDDVEERFFHRKLDQLLAISGESGEEEDVRKFVMETIRPHVDRITVDGYGNLLAEKRGRNGGPVILLNAHLDTYEPLAVNRNIIKDGDIWSSDKGILGADDRAGVAVLLQVAESLSSNAFSGKVKFAFTVEEEVGLLGARNMEEHFFWDVDAAIVVDRRGTGDIVTSWGGSAPFCHPEYGEFFEKVAEEAGLQGWRCTAGGSSDTRIWASHGIESVNVSVGYGNEHTDMEYLDVRAAFQTYRLVKEAIARNMELRKLLRNIRRTNRHIHRNYGTSRSREKRV